VRFLIDAQLPPALVDWLQNRGYEAQHVFDVGLSRAEDGAVWHASRSGDIIITKDEDFAECTTRLDGPQVVWLRIGNTTNPVLLDWLDARWAEVIRFIDEGNPLIEVR